MEPVPSGKAVETEPHRHHRGPGTTRGSGFRSLPSVVRGTGESYLSPAWISPDRSFENHRHSPTMKESGGPRLKATKTSASGQRSGCNSGIELRIDQAGLVQP